MAEHEKPAGFAKEQNGPFLFRFESDIERSLRRFPMALRFKMDRCCVHWSLQTWQSLPEAARHQIFAAPANTAFEIEQFIAMATAAISAADRAIEPLAVLPPSAVLASEVTIMPDEVAAHIAIAAPASPLTPQRWSHLTALERFALIKLSRPGHRNRGFAELLAEIAERLPVLEPGEGGR